MKHRAALGILLIGSLAGWRWFWTARSFATPASRAGDARVGVAPAATSSHAAAHALSVTSPAVSSRSAAHPPRVPQGHSSATDAPTLWPAVDAGASSQPAVEAAGIAMMRARERVLNERQGRWEDGISAQISEFAADQHLTQEQEDELFVIMTAASDALRDGLREAIRPGAVPSPAAIQQVLDTAYANADREAREVLTDTQYKAYEAIRARGGLIGPNPVTAPAPVRMP